MLTSKKKKPAASIRNPLSWERANIRQSCETVLADIEASDRFLALMQRSDLPNKNLFFKYRADQKSDVLLNFFLPAVTQALRRPWEALIVCVSGKENRDAIRDLTLGHSRSYLDWDFSQNRYGAGVALLRHAAIIALDMDTESDCLRILLDEWHACLLTEPALSSVPHIMLLDSESIPTSALTDTDQMHCWRWTIGLMHCNDLERDRCLLDHCSTGLVFGLEGEKETVFFTGLLGRPANLPRGEVYIASHPYWSRDMLTSRARVFDPAKKLFSFFPPPLEYEEITEEVNSDPCPTN